MHDTAIESHETERARTDFIGKAHRASEISRKAFATVDRTSNHDVAGAQESSHEIYEDVGALGVVGPS